MMMALRLAWCPASISLWRRFLCRRFVYTPVKGVILPHQLRTIDCKARHSEKLCVVPQATLQDTRSRLKVLLSL
jgi:hypothetical protein